MKNNVMSIIDTDMYEVPAEVSKIEAIIYDWVVNNYGESEASDPSWNIHELAEHLEAKLKNAEYKQENTVVYKL